MRQGYKDSLIQLGLDPSDFSIPDDPPPSEWWRLFVWMLSTKPGEAESFWALDIGPWFCLRAAYRRRNSGRFY